MVLIADQFNHMIRGIDLVSGDVSTVAGTGEPGHADKVGLKSQLHSPSALAMWGKNCYISDRDNNMIRCLDVDAGCVTTVAGNGFPGHRDGIANQAKFSSPIGLAVSMDTNQLFVADSDDHVIRCIDLSKGEVTTIAGSN